MMAINGSIIMGLTNFLIGLVFAYATWHAMPELINFVSSALLRNVLWVVYIALLAFVVIIRPAKIIIKKY